MGKRDTVVERRRRADNRLTVPPPAVVSTTRAADIELVLAGRVYPVGGAIEGDVTLEATTDQAATVTFSVRDVAGGLRRMLVDREGISRDGARATIDGTVYTLSTWTVDDGSLVTLTLEDDVAYRLRQRWKRITATRGQVTRAGFIRRLCEEAGESPEPEITVWIPEVLDRQPVAKGE